MALDPQLEALLRSGQQNLVEGSEMANLPPDDGEFIALLKKFTLKPHPVKDPKTKQPTGKTTFAAAMTLSLLEGGSLPDGYSWVTRYYGHVPMQLGQLGTFGACLMGKPAQGLDIVEMANALKEAEGKACFAISVTRDRSADRKQVYINMVARQLIEDDEKK